MAGRVIKGDCMNVQQWPQAAQAALKMLESKAMHKKTTKTILEKMQEDGEVSTEDFTNVKVSP